jgi:hypothetical protein
MSRQSVFAFMVLLVVVSGCGSSAAGGGPSGGTDGGTVGGGAATNIGQVGGKPFSWASGSFLIGMPDPGPNGLRATVLYVFEKPIACSAISHVGWDAPVVLGQNQVLEMRAIGPVPGPFKVVGPPPAGNTATAMGEVAVNQLDNGRSADPEQVFNGGTVTIDAIVDKESAHGSFDVGFEKGALTGTFEAVYCPTGVEP